MTELVSESVDDDTSSSEEFGTSGLPATMATPSIDRIREVARQIEPHVLRTPCLPYSGAAVGSHERLSLFVKLELLQKTGSFKARGAINTVRNLSAAEAGVTAFSAGNHAIATAYAAQAMGCSARVVMPRTANPFRVERCRAYGAEIEFGDTISDLLEIVSRLQREEGRLLVHPFEGIHTVEGTATVGLELADDVESLDVVVVPVGGGGLIAGVASAVKQLQPNCRVIGVEPAGARGMADSVAAGAPLETVPVNTIADSLGAPMHAPMTYSLVAQHVDELVQVSDEQMRAAMRHWFTEMKLAVEPACAAGLAALMFADPGRFSDQRVGLVACGTNIDVTTWLRLLDGQ